MNTVNELGKYDYLTEEFLEKTKSVVKEAHGELDT